MEFLAIGTAVKKIPGMRTKSDTLLPQAIIKDVDTFVDSTRSIDLGIGRKDSARRTQGGPLAIVIFFIVVLFYLFQFFLIRHH